LEPYLNIALDRRLHDVGASVLREPGEAGGSDFARWMQQAQNEPTPTPSAPPVAATYTIGSGDTLTRVVQQVAQQRGMTLEPETRHRLALELAAHNRIGNPDRILPGQVLQLAGLQQSLEAVGSGPLTARTAPIPTPTPTSTPATPLARWPSPPVASTQGWLAGRSAARGSQALAPSDGGVRAHPVLHQTLERAVSRGFIPPQERQAVHDKILALAQKYRFAPDDFARMTLMESDGLNPRASNQRCHGIIQFCDGPNRGAATVGFAQQPRAILGLSVYQQLSLVDTYFKEAGLGKQGPATLDDLYLTVLQPTARVEKQAHVPLPILGPQARDLHIGADTSQAITRQSIVQGLLKNTREKLSSMFGAPAPVPPRAPTAQVSQLGELGEPPLTPRP